VIDQRKNIGSSFDEFLGQEAILNVATAVTVKRVNAWQIEAEMKEQNLTKASMVKKCDIAGDCPEPSDGCD
jgi:hypothetical protein